MDIIGLLIKILYVMNKDIFWSYFSIKWSGVCRSPPESTGVHWSPLESAGVHQISLESAGVQRSPAYSSMWHSCDKLESGGVRWQLMESGGLRRSVWGSVKYWQFAIFLRDIKEGWGHWGLRWSNVSLLQVFLQPMIQLFLFLGG